MKRGLIPKRDLEPWVEHMWDVAIPPCVDRDDPATWVDPGQLQGWGPSAVCKSARLAPFPHLKTISCQDRIEPNARKR